MRAADCIFCKIVDRVAPAVIVSETADLLTIMDLYPATPGHMLVLPKEHFPDIYALPEDLGARLMSHAIELAKAAQLQLQPAGMNLIQSNGAVAGQTIAHFHLHVVPRYVDDGVTLLFGHSRTASDIKKLEQLAIVVRDGYRAAATGRVQQPRGAARTSRQ